MSNANFNRAREAKNDEFYTMYTDIDSEVLGYDLEQFKGKTVLCPCDDPVESNFTLFFIKNFNYLGLHKLISTGYNKGGHGIKYELTGDINGDSRINQKDIITTELSSDGDFRSEEVTALRDEADIIVTNPPFSLFREFLQWINPDEKKFIILGTIGAVGYRDVFPLIKNNKIWLGMGSNLSLELRLPDSATKYKRIVNGVKYGVVPACTWITNLQHRNRTEPVDLLTMDYREKRGVVYKHYDNYDAIEVPETKLIPSDYTGVMCVPVSFLTRYNPDQFEIIGSASRHAWSNDRDTLLSVGFDPTVPSGGGLGIPVLDGKPTYARILIRNKFNN